MEIVDIRLWRYRTRLTEPVVARPGLVLRDRDSLLISLETADGRVGWGEAAPLPGFSRDTLSEVVAAATALAREGMAPGPASSMGSRNILEGNGVPDSVPSLQFAVETALEVVSSDSPDCAEPVRTARLLQGTPDTMLEDVLASVQQGYHTLKVKVGRRRVEDDVAWIRALRGRIGPGVELRVDANRAWGLPDALQFAQGTRDLGISYVEEPLHSVEHLERLVRETGLPVALDETLVNEATAADWEIPEYVDALVLKPTLLGRRMQVLAEAATASGTRAVMSSSYETGVGTAAVARASWATGPDAPAVGIGTIAWLAEDCLAPAVDFLVPELVARDISGDRIRPNVEKLHPIPVT